MKTILILLFSITNLFAQKRQTTEYVTIKTYVRNGALEKPFKIGYLAYLPENYGCSGTSFPLIISFHGNGEKGTLTPDVLRKSFLPNRLDNGLNIPFIVISPQTNGYRPAWSNAQFYRELLDSIKLKYKIDTNKIFLVGYSGGGEGVCTWVKSGLPFAGIGTFSFVNKLTASETCALNDKKVWSFHCLDDATVGVGNTKNLILNIKKCDPNAIPKTTYYATGAHNSWSRGLATDSLFNYFLGK